MEIFSTAWQCNTKTRSRVIQLDSSMEYLRTIRSRSCIWNTILTRLLVGAALPRSQVDVHGFPQIP